jgi:hypothetical protein
MVGSDVSPVAVPLRPVFERMSVKSTMYQSGKRTLLAALILFAPMFTACEQVDRISSVEVTDVTVAAKKKIARVVKANVTASGSAEGFASAGKGTTLRVGQYKLVVPKGAVNRKTRFVLTVLPGTSVTVSLKAYEAGSGIEVSTFRRELFLTLPYSAIDPSAIDNESKLLVANVSEDGTESVLEIADTNVDNNAKTVTGKITHFSIWAIAREIFAKEIIVGID